MWIRKIILLLLWILPFGGYTQTDTTYCQPIRTARLLVGDAYAKRIQDSVIVELSGKIRLLEAEKATTWYNFNAELNNERQKTQVAKELSEHYKQLSESYQAENKWLRKREKKARLGKNLAILVGIGLAVLFVSQ